MGHQNAETRLGSGNERWAVFRGGSGARRCWAPGLDGLRPAASTWVAAGRRRSSHHLRGQERPDLAHVGRHQQHGGQHALGSHTMDPAAPRLVESFVGRPAGHALAGLPQALEPGQVQAMLDSCDPATATGRRDRAVLLMLSRMGLRAGEVAGLGLDDIDWRRGEITVLGKGGRRDRLPLPSDVGAAIVAYLRDGRPSGALDRTVFIAAQAPREALSYTGITTIAADAASRAGIPGPVHAHRLRHSAATAMLRGGGSLTEIGQALRHARPATTAIYAKVDIDALRPLGRPWPGQEETA